MAIARKDQSNVSASKQVVELWSPYCKARGWSGGDTADRLMRFFMQQPKTVQRWMRLEIDEPGEMGLVAGELEKIAAQLRGATDGQSVIDLREPGLREPRLKKPLKAR